MNTYTLYIDSTLFTNLHVGSDVILGDSGLSSNITFKAAFLMTQSEDTSQSHSFPVTFYPFRSFLFLC